MIDRDLDRCGRLHYMTLISCPICAGPVELAGEHPGCLIGHTFERSELQDRLGGAAEMALWSAIRALEDSASGARWRLTLPDPPGHLDRLIESSEREARILRDLVNNRESRSGRPGGTSDTEHRPDRW